MGRWLRWSCGRLVRVDLAVAFRGYEIAFCYEISDFSKSRSLAALGMTALCLATSELFWVSARKSRAEPFLLMIGALQRSSQEKFGSSHFI
jgi:hypothetical protein